LFKRGLSGKIGSYPASGVEEATIPPYWKRFETGLAAVGAVPANRFAPVSLRLIAKSGNVAALDAADWVCIRV
jgi:hypothetical protein